MKVVKGYHLECGLKGRIKGLDLHISALEEKNRADKSRIHQLESDLERSSSLVRVLSRALDRGGLDSVSSHDSDRSPRKSLNGRLSRASRTSELVPIAQSLVPLEDDEDDDARPSPRSAVQAVSDTELPRHNFGEEIIFYQRLPW